MISDFQRGKISWYVRPPEEHIEGAEIKEIPMEQAKDVGNE